MRACSTASGGVVFIPDEIKRKTNTVSYRELVEDEKPGPVARLLEKRPLFGKRKSAGKKAVKAKGRRAA